MSNGNGKKWSSATIIGKVEEIRDPVTFGNFTKRETLIVETGKYKNPLIVEWSGDAMAKVDDLGVGDTVSIHCKVRGREWKNPDTGEIRYFMSLSGQAIADHDTSERVPESHGSRRSGGPAPYGEDHDIPF